MKAMRCVAAFVMALGFSFAACSAEDDVAEDGAPTPSEATGGACTGVFCPSRSHCDLGSSGFPTCVGDQPICGGVQCAPFSMCCNAQCATPFCFGGSGACPPVACQ